MSLAHSTKMIRAFPCGEPLDGRPRFGMTPAQAILYRDLVDRFGDGDGQTFQIDSRGTAARLGFTAQSTIFHEAEQLCCRGWIEETEVHGYYRLVEPVMRFPSVPTRWEEE